ncbi:MAG TPA: pitrilysin family protein [Patescibacteria group bacterium]|nr:pitrilysin family protein [Patescibacteria group bacterium]
MRILLAILALLACATPAQASRDKILDIQVLKSAGGVEVWLVEDHSVPVVSLNFSFEGGLGFDPEDKPGVGRLVSILLDEGAEKLKSQDFQAKLSDNAISMSFTAGRDAFYGRLQTLSKNRDLGFDLLRMALTAPRFDQDAIDRMKAANVSEISENMGDPSWLVARSFNGMLFEGHYYSRPGYGNLASMATITRRDLQQFVKEQFGRDVLKIAIAGDITPAQVKAAVDHIFGALPEKAGNVELPPATLAYAGKTILLPLEAPQTYIISAQPALPRNDKDWHAAMIMNYILGGGSFNARLMKEIREKRGLTYGVYSSITNMKNADIIQANMSASNEKVEEAVRLLKESWASMAKDGPTADELADAKSYLTGSLLLQLTSTGDISGALNDIQRDGLGPDYINNRNAMVNAVSMADVKRVSAKLLQADKLTTILVGKPKNMNVDILLDRPPGMDEPPAEKQ